MTAEYLSNSVAAASRRERAILRRTKGFVEVGRMYRGSARVVLLGER